MKEKLIKKPGTDQLLSKEMLSKIVGKKYYATAGGKRLPLSVDPKTGNVMKLKNKNKDKSIPCSCGRITMCRGTVNGVKAVNPKDEYHFGVCQDCQKVYVYGKAKDISKSLLDLIKAVIPTPHTSEGRVNFDGVGAGQSIWITITHEGPLEGRHVLITKRPDGDFAITGGAGVARDKGYFHAALKMKTNNKPLTPEEIERRQNAKERKKSEWKKKRKFVREHQLEIGKQEGEINEHKNRLWKEFGLSTDKEIQKKMDDLHGAIFSKLSTSGYKEEDAKDIADSVVDAERKRVNQERVDLMKEVEENIKDKIGKDEGDDEESDKDAEETPEPESEEEAPEPDEKEEEESPEEEPEEEDESEDEDDEESEPEDEEPEDDEESDDEEEDEEEEPAEEPEPEEVPAELEPVDEDEVDDIEVPEAKNDEPLTDGDKKELAEKLVNELVDKTPANEMKHGKFVDVNLKTKDKRAKVMQLMGHYKNAKDNLRHYKRRRIDSVADENEGSVTSTNFNSDAKLTDKEAEEMIRKSLGDDKDMEKRQSFYERVADLARDKDDPEGGFNPYSPFGHLNAHMVDGGLGYRDGGAVRTLNQVAMQLGQNDFMRGELVDALGIQGAAEMMLSELKKRGVSEDDMRRVLDDASANVDKSLNQALQIDETLQKNRKVFDGQHQEGYLGDADYNIKVADNLASQQQNIGAALGSLETMGTLKLALDKGIPDKVSLNANGDLDQLRNRLARSISKGASRSLRGARGGKAYINAKKLSRYMDKYHASTANTATLNQIAKGEFNTGDLTIPGVKAGAGQAVSFRPGQESDLRHIMKQMDILEEEKGTPNSSKTIRSVGVFMNREVGAGKAQPLDAKLLTPTGWKLMGNIQVGDQVIAVDGTPTEVLGVYPQGEKAVFDVFFHDGAKTQCCDEHLWKTQTAQERNNYQRGMLKFSGEIRSLNEIRHSLVSSNKGLKNHSIGIVEKVTLQEQAFPLHPYVMGILIGDGHIGDGSVSLSTPDEQVLKIVADLLPHEVSLKHKGDYDYYITKEVKGYGKNPVLDAMREVGLAGKNAPDKFVPDCYKFNNDKVRVSVLRGLMDSDGTVSEDGTRVSFCSTSQQLASDVVFLVQSLGGTARIKPMTKSFTYKGEKKQGVPAYNVSVCMPPEINPFWLHRKAVKVVPKTKYKPVRYVVDVQSAGKKECQCIMVAHPSHLYVTDDFIVTHNTLASLAAGQMLLNKEPEGSTRTVIHTVPESLLGNWKDEADKVLDNPNLIAFGRNTSRKREEEGEKIDESLLMKKDKLESTVQKILNGNTPRRIVIGQNALQTKVSVRVPGSKAKQVMTVAKALNYTQPLLVSHDEPQNMLTAGKGVLGSAGKEALRLGSKVTDLEGNKLSTVRLALTATPARDRPDQLYDMGNWVTGGAIGTRKSFISKNGNLGQGTTTFERSEGDAVLAKMGTQMVSERGKKNHIMKTSESMSKMNTAQKEAQGAISNEYGPHIQKLHDAANGKRFTAGVYKVKMASGWKDKQLDTKEDAQYWLDRTQNAHDEAQAKNLYSKAPGNNWHNSGAFETASSELDKQEKLTPGGSRIIWVRDEGGKKLAEKMLAEKYPDAAVTDMFDKKTLEQNKAAFKKGDAKFVIMPYSENAGHNMQEAAGSVFIGIPKHFVDKVQAEGRICRDPRKGDPLISTVTYEDSPHDIAQRESYDFQKRFIAGTNYTIRDAESSPMPDAPDSPMAMAQATI